MPRRAAPSFGKRLNHRRVRPPNYRYARLLLPTGFHRNDDHVAPPLVPVIADAVILPDTRILHVVLYGRDELGRSRPLYNVHFTGARRDIFTIKLDPQDPNACYVYPTNIGTAVLTATATPTPAPIPIQLELELTITIVPGLAVSITIEYSVSGGPRKHPAGTTPTISVPLNKTAVVTLVALDADGLEVPVTNIDWTSTPSSFWHTTPNADPFKVNLIPDAVGFDFPLHVSCDADVSGEVLTITKDTPVSILDTAATELEALYDVEWP